MKKAQHMSSKAKRHSAYWRGVRAENWAALLLQIKGYRILARRFKTPHGEIDLIAKRFKSIVFVEVKARASLDQAAFSVSLRQQRRIVKGALFWQAKQSQKLCETNDPQTYRFDVILFAPRRWPRHMTNAFFIDRSAGI